MNHTHLSPETPDTPSFHQEVKRRHTPDQRAEILDFIERYNAKNGRGGLKAAAEKYDISVVSLSTWRKKARTFSNQRIPIVSSETTQILATMQDLLAKIHRTEKQLEELKQQFQACRSSL